MTDMPAKKPRMLATLLLDGSTSMLEHLQPTLIGVNKWIADWREPVEGVDMRLSLVRFNSRDVLNESQGPFAFPSLARGFPTQGALLTHMRENVAPADCPALGAHEYIPRGNTPLIDAAIDTIGWIEAAVAGRDDIDVALGIQTDGQENSSLRGMDELQALIARKAAEGWQFTFMGCGIESYAYRQAQAMGLSAAQTVLYSKDKDRTEAAFAANAASTRAYALRASASVSYTDAQKFAAGDLS